MKDIKAYGGGGKGGGSSRQPVEHPDNLRSIARARVLLLMSEGPIQGAATGNNDFLKSIYLNGTQAQNDDGSLNFPDIGLGYTLGTQDQDYIKGFPASENTVNVGVPLQAGRPWTQQITNSQLSAVVVNFGVNQLVQINEENMDRTGTVVNYRVQLQVGTGAFTDVVAGGFSFDGKTTSGYERSHRINLPSATRWAIRVIRDTPDSTSDTLQNATYIGSYVEVIDAKLRYPMSALVGISIDAEHFSGGVPTVAFRGRGRIVSVPDNYNPETRTYSGVWSGGFKNAWTNNPAWIFYDLVTNDRYGLGRRITRAQIDRYTLYQIGRYCDEMVPDGFGGTEPRFTCNVYIQKASDALRVISDLASIFRGMSYWAAGLVRVSADIPSDPVHSFTNANVKGGAFSRTASGLRQRYSVAAVSYNDMTDFGRQKVEFVQDDSAVTRYGIRELQVTAFGCTSRGQAHRVGKYALVTAKVETGGIKFAVGLDQMKIQPSDVIRVHDQHRAGRRQAGRIKERVSANSLIVDDAGGARVGDTIFIDDYSANINAINGNTISVSSALPTDIAQKVWAVESSNLKPELFRVISIKEVSGNGIEYEIEAVEHNPSKYSAVDYGTKLESFPTTVIPPRAQEAPRNVLVSSYYVIREGVSSHTLRIAFDKPKGAVRYEVQFRRNHSEWVNLPTTSSNSVEVDNVYAGAYEARVRAINSLDVPSLWAYSEITQIDGLTGEPPSLRTLTTEPIPWGIVLRWSFYSGANTIERTQLRYSTTSSFEDSQLLGDYAYPTNMYAHDNLRAGAELWYWGRVADKNGVYGPWLPLESEEGVYGVTSLNADEYNEIITKEIVGSALGQQLMEDIESIPDIQDQLAGLGVSLGQLGVNLVQLGVDLDALGEHVTNVDDAIASLNLDIDAIESQLSSAGIELSEIGIKFDDIEDKFYATDAEIAALQGQLSEIIGTEDWDPSSSYLEGTLVKDSGALYRAAKDVPAGTPLTDTEFWTKVGDYASLGEAVTSLLARMSIVESNVNSLTGEVTTIAQQVSVLSSDLQTVDGKTNANTIAINETKTQVTELEGDVTANTQSIDTLNTVVTSLDGQVQGNASAIDRIETEVSEIDGTVKSISERETLLVASVRDIDDGSGALADVLNEHDSRAWIKENQTAIATNEQAIARVETELGARIDDNSSYISQAFEAVADLDEAQSTITTELWSAVGDNQAAIQNTNQTIADNQSAQALINDQLSSRIDDADSGNAANANAINTLKTRVDGHDDELLSQAQSISQLEAGLTDAQSGIDANATAINEVDTRVTAVDGRVTANASDISQLQSDLSNVDGSVGANSQAISALTTRVDDHDGEMQSQAQSITALETGLDDANAGISANAGAITQLSSEVSAIDGVVQSNSQSITKLENDLADVDSNAQANSQAIQSLDSRVESIDGRVEANSTQLTALTSEIESLDGEVKGNAQAIEKIETDVSIIDGQVSSLAQRESLIVASLRDDDGGSGQLADALNTHQNRAWIYQNQTAIANNEQSIARVETELGAQISGNTALITQLAETVADNDSAQSTISNQLSSRIDDVEEDVSANAAGITQLITRVDNHDGVLSSYGSSITQLQNDLSTSDGKITGNTESINLLDGKIDVVDGRVTANSSEITQLKSRVEATEGGISANSTAIDSLETRVEVNEGAISSQGSSITQLQNNLSTANGKITGNTESINLLDGKVDIVDGKVTANASEITQLKSRVGVAESGISSNSTAISNLQTSVSAQGDTISSQGSSITALQNDLTSAEGNITANAGAISTLQTTVSSQGSLISSQGSAITQLQNRVDDPSTGLSANAGAISSLNTSVSNLDGRLTAQAQSINQIESSVGSVSASVQDLSNTVTTIDGRLEATRTIKVAVNSGGTRYLAGIGIGVDNATGGMQSQVVVVADRFSVMHTINAAPRAVFSVQGGVAFINDAMIRNASITTAKINNAAITNAKIGNAAITTAKIGTAQVDTLRIGGNAVTVPVATFTRGNVHINENWSTVASLYLPHVSGSPPYLISGGCKFTTDRASAEVSLRVISSDRSEHLLSFGPVDIGAGREVPMFAQVMINFSRDVTLSLQVRGVKHGSTALVSGYRTITAIGFRR